jgi:histidinol-phosphate aminotransferase
MKPIETLVRKNIQNMKPYSSARDEFSGEAELYLDANENPYQTEFNRYPDPHQRQLKEKIAQLKGVKSDQVFLGNGSDEAIDLLIRAFCEPYQDAVMIVEPTYGMYSVCAAVNAITVQSISLTNEFELNTEAILTAINDSTKIIFLCSPNNPTGNLLDKEKVLQIAQFFNGLLVIDEAYIDFSDDEGFMKYLNLFPNVVILQTFSKSWGLAGLRLGMCFASKNIIDVLTKIKYPYNVNTLTQQLALKALKNIEQKKQWITEITKERTNLKAELEKMPLVEKVFASDANFLLVKFKNASHVFSYLLDRKIIVRDRSSVQSGCLRITIGTPKENNTLLKALIQL